MNKGNFLTQKRFSNIISTDIVSGNLTATISDHLPQFPIAPEIFRNSPSKKSNYLERDFNQENFTLDYFSVNWKNIFNLQKCDVNHCLQSFFPISIINPILRSTHKKIHT